MAVVDQKARYRRYAALCYEIAAKAGVARATSIIRLGDNYAALAIDPESVPSNLVFPAQHVEVECKKCGRSMQVAYSLPRVGEMPPQKAFWCETCGGTLIWKSELPRSVLPQQNRWITRYVAVSFRLVDRRFAPGLAVECPDGALAIKRAQLMLQEMEIVGSVAFARRNNQDTGEFDVAAILGTYGNLPEGFDIA